MTTAPHDHPEAAGPALERDTEVRPLGSFRLFADYHHDVDSAVVLFAMAHVLASDAASIVDVGCGRGALIDPDIGERRLHDLRGPGRVVTGIDVDPVGAENPVIDEFRQIQDGRWPLDDGSVDLVVCDWVLEHIVEPEAFVSELRRVLRPGGAFLARTVSRASLLSKSARLVPNAQHARALSRLQPARAEQDVFPTVYRMNTPRDLAKVLDDDFEWATSFHAGLHHYAKPWPRLAKALTVIEPRLPKRNRVAMILAARKKS